MNADAASGAGGSPAGGSLADAMYAARLAVSEWVAASDPAQSDMAPVSDAAAVAGHEAWARVEAVLRRLSGERAEGTTTSVSSLVASLRQSGRLTIDDAHALIDLEACTRRPAAGVQTADIAAAGLTALENAVSAVGGGAAASPLRSEYQQAAARAAAPPPSSPPPAPPPRAAAPPLTPTPPASPPPPAGAGAAPPAAAAGWLPVPKTGGSGRSSAFVVGLILVCVVGAGIAALVWRGVGASDPLADGIAAYGQGQRMAARIAFEKAATSEPQDARSLIYLGRMAREDGDLAQARRLLERAVEREPGRALAHRELAAALLADGQPELARRFYVRALGIEPDDRLAQGFLGCALHRLGRLDEARRWFDRAGPGDWSACQAERPPMMPPPVLP